MRPYIVIFALFCGIASAAEPTPVAPSNPIEVKVEIGSTGTINGNAKVIEKAVITKKAVKVFTSIEMREANGFSHYELPFDNDGAQRLIGVLTEILAKPDTDAKKEIEPNTIVINRENKEGKRIISIIQNEGRLDPPCVRLDADNAQLLVILLSRAVGVNAWMQEKLPAFQK